MRGTVFVICGAKERARITPACAGNSIFMFDTGFIAKDHPRVCGEQPPFMAVGQSAGGSPPRVRGTDDEQDLNIAKVGITPACAGNSRYPCHGHAQGRDHPRVCGEQGDGEVDEVLLEGSPPRVRGTDHESHGAIYARRITPACAGNSLKLIFIQITTKDHPRVCGEQARGRWRSHGLAGSPPRVRGTGVFIQSESKSVRITPACAGNSCRIFKHVKV